MSKRKIVTATATRKVHPEDAFHVCGVLDDQRLTLDVAIDELDKIEAELSADHIRVDAEAVRVNIVDARAHLRHAKVFITQARRKILPMTKRKPR